VSTVAVIDYGSGNLRSAAKALERAGNGVEVLVTARAAEVARADRIVLPGVGAFADCMRGLSTLDGMVEALGEAVIGRARPFLGICVGMQLMATRGCEHGTHDGLGWLAGDVVPIATEDRALKVPHMGWNEIALSRPDHPLFRGLGDGSHFYFVHSYRFLPAESSSVLATVEYGGAIAAAVGRRNLVGTQFHPEKSQDAGLALLGNFLGWRP